VLLLDEPLSNLDARLRKDMLFDLKRIQQESGVTFLYVTHDQSEALSVSDQVVVMNQGRIMQLGTPREVYDQPSNLFVASFVGNANTLQASIVSLNKDKAVVRWSEQGELVLPECGKVPETSVVNIALKRHGIRVTSSQDGVGAFRTMGKVKRTYFLGQYDELSVDVGGKELFAFAPPGRYETGDQVAISIEPGTYQIFPTNTGQEAPSLHMQTVPRQQ